MNSSTSSQPGQHLEVRAGGQPPARRAGGRCPTGWPCPSPSRAPMPCTNICSGRFAVSAGSFCRSEPAAALRGLASGALPASISAFVEFREGLGRDEDFAADFHLGREAAAGELLRDFLDGQHVVGDVLAGGAVAAGGGPDQYAVAVEQVHGQAVDLQLGEPAPVAAVAELRDAGLGLGRSRPPVPPARRRPPGCTSAAGVRRRRTRRRPRRRPPGWANRWPPVPDAAPRLSSSRR